MTEEQLREIEGRQGLVKSTETSSHRASVLITEDIPALVNEVRKSQEKAYTANAVAVREVLTSMAKDGEIDALTAGQAEVAIIERFGKILRGDGNE